MIRSCFAVACLAAAMPLAAQVCRLSVAGLNRNRHITGDISAECPNPIHSAPFGNWGATSNFGSKRDGHQFDGWCHETRICDNAGNCRLDCLDGWYEWNSCTNHQLYKAPNCTLYNSAGCTGQATTTGVNVLGTQTVDIPVSCPIASAGSATYDRGGCSDVRNYSRSNNYMSLYELDPITGDELVQSVYFPSTTADLQCNAWGCPSSTSNWVNPIEWDSPKSPAKVFAEMAMIVNFGTFVDANNSCRIAPLAAQTVSSATLRVQAVAPDSLASVFSGDIAGSTETATTRPLPTTLGGLQVRITDSANTGRNAELLFVSPRQINFVVPSAVRDGAAAVSVVAGSTVRATGTLQVTRVQPGLFAAAGNGTGTAAAVGIRVAANGSQSSQLSFECKDDGCIPTPLDLGGSTEQFVLVLFGTGIRAVSSLQAVQANVGGVPVTVQFAGAQPTFTGLDQVNLLLPKSLAGRGIVPLELSVDGKAANPLSVWIR